MLTSQNSITTIPPTSFSTKQKQARIAYLSNQTVASLIATPFNVLIQIRAEAQFYVDPQLKAFSVALKKQIRIKQIQAYTLKDTIYLNLEQIDELIAEIKEKLGDDPRLSKRKTVLEGVSRRRSRTQKSWSGRVQKFFSRLLWGEQPRKVGQIVERYMNMDMGKFTLQDFKDFKPQQDSQEQRLINGETFFTKKND